MARTADPKGVIRLGGALFGVLTWDFVGGVGVGYGADGVEGFCFVGVADGGGVVVVLVYVELGVDGADDEGAGVVGAVFVGLGRVGEEV
ncbi:hypothetical protein [Amycolatopsis minnesotensis]|uniref:hypothetical protein n=1 Tax=Amycolatopsis minnesotensis TaxID=337894 RepID=UPI0031D393A7